VASLVLGILGVLILPAVAGLVCGVVAIIQINRSSGALRGRGIAIAGTIVSGLMLAMIPIIAILLGLMLPALAQAKGKAQAIMGLNNVKQIALAVHLYAVDSKGVLPGATNWCDALKPYLGTEAVFRRPAEPGEPGQAFSSYGLNARIAGAKIAEVDPSTVLIFELESPGWNVTGGAGQMRRPGRGPGTVSVGFADGHAETIGPGVRLDSLRWEP
jgi:prepilin-type processing-associated H-X9-DG protein